MSQVMSGMKFVDPDSDTQIFVRSTEDECTIEITGEIASNTVRLFKQAVTEAESRVCKEKWVILSSGGGLVKPAMEIGKIIRNKKYNTQIHHGNSCGSACGFIFISGTTRAVSSSFLPTRIGFHQISKRNGSDLQCVTDANNQASVLLNRYAHAMLDDRAAKLFYDRVMQTDCNTMTYIGTEEAIAEGIANASKRNCNNCALLQ